MPNVSYPLQSPVGGWRTDYPDDNMPENTALIFDNLISDGKNVFVRSGRETYADLATLTFVDTMAEWIWQGDAQLLAASGGKIFNATNPTTVVTLGSGFLSDQWQWSQHNNFTIFVNGTDPGQKYNGTALTAWAPTLPVGLTTSDILVIGTYKERIFCGVKDSLTVVFGGPQNVEGTFQSFPLDSVATKGGTLVSIGTYSTDTGSGPDDFVVFFTSQGEMIAYTGNDPSNPSAWSLVGVYEMPRPVGLRAFHKPKTSNGAVITEHGFFLIDEIIRGIPRVNRRGAAVENAVLQSHSRYEFQFGWDIVDYSHGDLTIANIPDSVGGENFVQFVVHGSGAWSRFTNWNARSWIEWQDRLFFGGTDGKIQECDVGYSEDGENLTFDCKTAYNYFSLRNIRKRYQGIRISYRSLGKFPISIDWDVDFEDKAPAYNASSTISTSSPWGSPWGSPWSEPDQLVKAWRGIRGEGYSGSLRLRGSTIAQPFLWYSWEPLFEVGAVR